MLNQKLYYNYKEYKEEDLEQIECIEEEDGTIRNRFLIKNLDKSPIFIEPVPDTKYTKWTVNDKDQNYDITPPIKYDYSSSLLANRPFISGVSNCDISDYNYIDYGYKSYSYPSAYKRVPVKTARDPYKKTLDKTDMTIDRAFKILMEHAQKLELEDNNPVNRDALEQTTKILEKHAKRIEEEANKLQEEVVVEQPKKEKPKKKSFIESLRHLFER